MGQVNSQRRISTVESMRQENYSSPISTRNSNDNSKSGPTASPLTQWKLSRTWEKYLSRRKQIICQVPGCNMRPSSEKVMPWQRWKWLSEHMVYVHRLAPAAEIPKM